MIFAIVAIGCQTESEDTISLQERDIKTVMEAHVDELMAIPGVTVDAEKVAAATLRNTLKNEDIFINQAGRTPSDPSVQTSTRARLEQLDSNEASIRATLDCLG